MLPAGWSRVRFPMRSLDFTAACSVYLPFLKVSIVKLIHVHSIVFEYDSHGRSYERFRLIHLRLMKFLSQSACLTRADVITETDNVACLEHAFRVFNQ
jgi:hypothetical protein